MTAIALHIGVGVGGAAGDWQPSDTMNAPRHLPVFHFANLDDLIEHLPHSCPLVGVELDAKSVPLSQFTHPESAVYLLGAEDRGLTVETIENCNKLVQIEAPVPWSMNVAVAGSIIMYDRFIKAKKIALDTSKLSV